MIELLFVLIIILLLLITAGLIGFCVTLVIVKKYEEKIDETGGF